MTALNIAIDNRDEGLIIKKPNSTYQPDKRKGSMIVFCFVRFASVLYPSLFSRVYI